MSNLLDDDNDDDDIQEDDEDKIMHLQKATIAWSPPQVILQNWQNFTWANFLQTDMKIIL